MRILVTGSREWDDYETLSATLSVTIGGARNLGENPIIVHGACPTGADRMAAHICELYDIPTEPHPADWDKHGKAAGFIRNQEMVDAGADMCLAFFQAGAENKGTSDCVRRATRAGIPVTPIYGEPD